MNTSKSFDLDDGEKVKVEYDALGREVLKMTLTAGGSVLERIEYRYSSDNKLAEWKWYDSAGVLLRSFLGDMQRGEILNVRKSMDAIWTISREGAKGDTQ